MLRFQEINGSSVKGVRLVTSLRILEAVTADIVERPGAPINLANFSMEPWGTLTVLIRAQ